MSRAGMLSTHACQNAFRASCSTFRAVFPHRGAQDHSAVRPRVLIAPQTCGPAVRHRAKRPPSTASPTPTGPPGTQPLAIHLCTVKLRAPPLGIIQVRCKINNYVSEVSRWSSTRVRDLCNLHGYAVLTSNTHVQACTRIKFSRQIQRKSHGVRRVCPRQAGFPLLILLLHFNRYAAVATNAACVAAQKTCRASGRRKLRATQVIALQSASLASLSVRGYVGRALRRTGVPEFREGDPLQIGHAFESARRSFVHGPQNLWPQPAIHGTARPIGCLQIVHWVPFVAPVLKPSRASTSVKARSILSCSSPAIMQSSSTSPVAFCRSCSAWSLL
mmetsp:Transcript_5596/g.12194  ORF Transcript_5596/g.12194 Transcript_5596/m.12194 type:complete len:331 (-) Transcript_5596:929-1921(-)